MWDPVLLRSQQPGWKPARKRRARPTLKNCWLCHKGTDAKVCATRKPNEDLWIKRPYQGRLCR